MQFKFTKFAAAFIASGIISLPLVAHASIESLNDFLEADAPFKKDFSLAGHDASIQFYGILDIGYEHGDHALPINDNLPQGLYSANRQNATYTSSQSTWFSGGLSQNRVGIKADTGLFDLGETNVKAVLNLETGFNPLGFELYNGAKSLVQNSGGSSSSQPLANQSISNESSQNGNFFNRAANAGLSFGEYGTATFGLQTNPLKDIFLAYDPVQADNFSALGQSGTWGGSGGVSENQRLQNSLKYTNSWALPSLPFEGAKATATGIYQWGNAINLDYGNSYGLSAGLESNKFGVQVAYYSATDAISATTSSTAGDIAYRAYNTQAGLIALRFNPVPELKISGGWEQFTRSAASDAALQNSSSTNHPSAYGSLWGYSVGAGAAGFTPGDTQEFNVLFLGAGYDFSAQFPKLTGLKLQAGYYDFISETPSTTHAISTAKQNSGRIGTWSAVLDYQINKRFDVYAAATNSHFTGPYYSGYDTNQTVIGTGVRFKF